MTSVYSIHSTWAYLSSYNVVASFFNIWEILTPLRLWAKLPWTMTWISSSIWSRLHFSSTSNPFKYFNNGLILHINMTMHSLISISTQYASILFLTLARSFGHQAVACPSLLVSTLKPFPCYLYLIKLSSHILFWINYMHTLNIISFILLPSAWTISTSFLLNGLYS